MDPNEYASGEEEEVLEEGVFWTCDFRGRLEGDILVLDSGGRCLTLEGGDMNSNGMDDCLVSGVTSCAVATVVLDSTAPGSDSRRRANDVVGKLFGVTPFSAVFVIVGSFSDCDLRSLSDIFVGKEYKLSAF